MKAELLTLVALSPLFWNLRAPVSTELAATDASDAWCVLLTSQISPSAASELWRVRDKTSRSYVRDKTSRSYARFKTEVEAMVRHVLTDGDLDEQLIVEAAFADSTDALPDFSEHERRYSWVSDLADSLDLQEVTRYRVSVADHINRK